MALAAALALTACAESPTQPPLEEALPEIAVDALNLEEAALDEAQADGIRRPVTTLQRLFQQALARIAERRGAEEAQLIAAEVQRLLDEALAAREAGDRATALRKLREVEVRTASTILLVFGPRVVERVLAVSEEGLARLNTHIAEAKAAGRDVSRLERIAARIAEIRTAGQRAFDAGNHVRALLLATRSVDLLRIVAGQTFVNR